MLKLITVIFLTLLLSSKIFAQKKEYRLIDKTSHANINRQLFAMLDAARPGITLMDNVFRAVKGKFIVYRFIATYQGLSFTNKQKEFHDLLIVKTDDKNKIISGYQYTLEWAEPPLETDLYQSTCKRIYLVDNMPIEKFVFERPWYYDKQGLKLKDSGHIRFVE